jgi:tetratricopeptide (TPR) repeat protein
MKALLGLALLISVGGCRWLARTYWLHKYDQEIAAATKALQQAKNDDERAKALGERGRGYSEKARYSAFAQCIDASQYTQLIGRALADHAQSTTLAPNLAEPYLLRGQTTYDRANVTGLELNESKNAKTTWLLMAQADFTRAIERDAHDVRAFDMRALTRSVLGDRNGAITDLTASMKIDGRAQGRLAEAYCERAGFRRQQKDLEGAIADYEKSVSLGGTRDGCSCEPHAPLASVYLESNQIDKAREIIRRAHAAQRWIPPELEQKLSGMQHP